MYGGRLTGRRYVGNTTLTAYRYIVIPPALASFAIVLDQFAFLRGPNKVKTLQHQSVTGDTLDEFFITPINVAWLNNKPRFKHLRIT